MERFGGVDLRVHFLLKYCGILTVLNMARVNKTWNHTVKRRIKPCRTTILTLRYLFANVWRPTDYIVRIFYYRRENRSIFWRLNKYGPRCMTRKIYYWILKNYLCKDRDRRDVILWIRKIQYELDDDLKKMGNFKSFKSP